jgi:hypothetical protein
MLRARLTLTIVSSPFTISGVTDVTAVSSGFYTSASVTREGGGPRRRLFPPRWA